MQHSVWFLDALKDISEFAEPERMDGVLGGLAEALETYATEVGISVDQHDEVLRLLGSSKSQATPIQNMDSV